MTLLKKPMRLQEKKYTARPCPQIKCVISLKIKISMLLVNILSGLAARVRYTKDLILYLKHLLKCLNIPLLYLVNQQETENSLPLTKKNSPNSQTYTFWVISILMAKNSKRSSETLSLLS